MQRGVTWMAGAMRSRATAWAVLVGLLAFLTFAATVRYSLVWDDLMILQSVERHLARGGLAGVLLSDFRLDPEQPLGFYRPLVLLSFVVDSAVGRMSPGVFHLTNVLLHTANTVLVFLAAMRLLGSLAPAVVSAAIFAAHPVHVESVAFVSGRTDLLATLFVLLAAVPWLAARRDGRRPRWRGLLLSSTAAGMAALAKEPAFLLPLLFLAWETVDGGFHAAAGWRRLQAAAPWLLGWSAAIAVVLFVRLVVAGIGFRVAPNLPPGSMVPASLMPDVWGTYLSLLWFPWPQVPYYLPEQMAGVPRVIGGVAATLAICLLAARSSRSWAYGLSWLVLFLIPVCGIVPLGGTLLAQRFLYLPSVGFCLLLGAALAHLARGRVHRTGIAVAATAVAGLSVATALSGAFWRDELSLSLQMTRRSPGYANGYAMLGNALGERGRKEEAVAVYQSALRKWPDDAVLHYDLGLTLLELGRVDAAAAEFRRSVSLSPGWARAWNNLGAALFQLGQVREARAAVERALELDPQSAAARENFDRLSKVTSGRPAD